jgi:hypothetical protein
VHPACTFLAAAGEGREKTEFLVPRRAVDIVFVGHHVLRILKRKSWLTVAATPIDDHWQSTEPNALMRNSRFRRGAPS